MSAPGAGGGPAAPGAAVLSHRQILTIFAGLMIGMFLAALDQTVVATAIRTIADDLRGLSLQAWATTAYLITATISTPLYGKLSDLYGRKPLFLTAISIFVVGSVACSFATSMYQLAAFRALQGLGAGGLFALALTIIGDVVAPRQRARYQGYFVAVFGTSSVVGPVAGGFLAGRPEILGIAGWRWVFLINVPLGIVALFVVARVLNVPHTKREHRIDWPGALALAVGLVPLLIVAEQGRAWGWASPRTLACFVIGVAGILAFLLAERRIGDDALLPLRFFRNGVFGWGSVAVVVVGMGMFGALALLPLYLQIVKGSTPTQAGLQMLPLVLGIMSMSVGSGQMISRTGRYKVWPVIGVTLMIVGLGSLSRIGVDTPYWQVAIAMVVVGWGLGANMQPLTLAVQNAMPVRDMGVATASVTFFRQMGGTLGTALFLSLLFSALGPRVAESLRAAAETPGFRAALADARVAAHPADAPIVRALQGAGPVPLDDSSFLSRADPVLARPILEAFAGAMSVVFLAAAAVLLLGLTAVLAMREVPLRTQSGIEARRSEELAGPQAGNPIEVLRPSATPVVVPAEAAPEPDTTTVGLPVTAGRQDGSPTRLAPPRAPQWQAGNGAAADGAGPGGAGASAQPDTQDRLRAMPLPDPERALAVVAEAEAARDEVRRAGRRLDAAVDELVAQGLSREQVRALLDLP